MVALFFWGPVWSDVHALSGSTVAFCHVVQPFVWIDPTAMPVAPIDTDSIAPNEMDRHRRDVRGHTGWIENRQARHLVLTTRALTSKT